MGFPSHRAGWYTPHWLDRLTFGIKQPSANEIRPDLQKLVPGDRVPDSDDWSTYFTVVTVDPPHSLVLHSTRHIIKPIKKIDFSWAFVLRGFSGGKTRLFIRARANYTPTSAAWLIEFVIGPGDFVNAGVMLRGIKSRAECGSGSAPTTPPLNAWRRRPGDERPTSVTGRRTSAKRSLWWRWVAATAAAAAFAWARLPALRP
jgi:hypothetical protein